MAKLRNKLVVTTKPRSYRYHKKYWDNFPLHFTYLSDRTTKPSFDVGLHYDQDMVREDLFLEQEDILQSYMPMCLYYHMKPDFEHYWFVEDNVSIEDPVSFFEAFEDNDADFISMYTFKEQSVNTQPNIPKIDNRTDSGNGWFFNFPGEKDIMYPDTTDLFGSYMPIVRISNNYLNRISSLTRMGLRGLSEGWLPTYINYFGGTLDTIFNSDSISEHFDQDKVSVKHKGCNVFWSFL